MIDKNLYQITSIKNPTKKIRIISKSELALIQDEINHLVVVANLNEAIVIYKHLKPLPILNNNIHNDAILRYESNSCQQYYIGKLSETPVVLTALNDMGSIKINASINITDEAIRIFSPKFAIMLGICASLNSKVSIGDVIIANPIVSYDSKKEFNSQVIYRGQRFYPYLLINRFDNISLQKFKNFRVFKGEVLSGETLVNSDQFKKNIMDAFPEIMALEMEGIGFSSICVKNNVQWILIKGVSDNGVNKKDEFQQTAAENSYLVSKLIFDTIFQSELLKFSKQALKRRSIFIAGALAKKDKVYSQFIKKLVNKLLGEGYRIVSALGRNVGNDILQATYQYLKNSNNPQIKIDNYLLTLQFPYSAIKSYGKEKLSDYYNIQRTLLLQECNIAIFLTGNKQINGKIILSDGMLHEFNIARKLNVLPIPIAFPNTMSLEIWKKCYAEYSEIYEKFFYSSENKKLIAW